MKFSANIKRYLQKHQGLSKSLDEEGSVIVETALGLPILLTMFVGVLEIGHYVFVSASVENAVLRASRFGVTGLTEEGSSRLEQVRDVIEQNTFGRVDMDTVQIDTLVYQQFADVGQPEPFTDDNNSETWDTGEAYVDVNGNGQWDDDMGTEGLGGGGDIVVYRISYNARSLSGFDYWANKTINVSSTVAVRNEPY